MVSLATAASTLTIGDGNVLLAIVVVSFVVSGGCVVGMLVTAVVLGLVGATVVDHFGMDGEVGVVTVDFGSRLDGGISTGFSVLVTVVSLAATLVG